MIKLIVLSSTYRQSSHSRPDLEQRDPQNRLSGAPTGFDCRPNSFVMRCYRPVVC